MPAESPRQPVDHDDARIRVRLDDLIALRQRVMRAAWRPVRTAVTTGNHASRRRGRGMDYLESRMYQAGDDVRHLDWRLTARSGQLHTKVFEEEHEQRVMLMVDCHASMHFGTRACFKSVQAARTAALIAWHVARAGGRVGALAFGPCRQVQGAAAGQRGALGVCGALARWDAGGFDAPAEQLSTAMHRLRPLLRGASHGILVTDGRSGDPDLEAALAACRRHLHVSVLLVTDPFESSAPPPGRFPLAWAGRRVMVNLLEARARQQFRAALSAPAQRLHAACTALGLPCLELDTRADPMDAVMALTSLARRRSR